MNRTNGLTPGIDYISNTINHAKDTKQSVILAVNSYENLQNRMREMEEKAKENSHTKTPEEIYFDPTEIEPIVFRDERER